MMKIFYQIENANKKIAVMIKEPNGNFVVEH